MPEEEKSPEDLQISEQEPEKTEEPEKKDEPKTFTQEEVDSLIGERLAKQARRLKKEQKTEKVAETPKQDLKAPKEEDFDTYEEFLRADARYAAKEEARALREQDKKERAKEAQNKKAREWEKKQTAAFKKHPDYYDAIDSISETTFPDLVLEAMNDSDLGAELAYHLAKHPDELEDLLDLSPRKAVMQLGRLEDKLTAKEPVKKSKLPNTPESPKGGSKDEAAYSEGDSFEKFRRIRNKELGRT